MSDSLKLNNLSNSYYKLEHIHEVRVTNRNMSYNMYTHFLRPFSPDLMSQSEEHVEQFFL